MMQIILSRELSTDSVDKKNKNLIRFFICKRDLCLGKKSMNIMD